MSQHETRILAVDDDEAILFTLRAIGKVAGWSMDTCSSPQRALDLVAERSYDLIVVDYHMPDMDGVVLVRRIRAVDHDVPIIVLTVDERLSLAERFSEAGASDFAVKPVKAADFISRVRLNLSGQRGKGDEGRSSMPKGLSQQTMNKVVAALASENEWLGAEDLAVRAGVSYQTVWRYLDALESDGRARVRLVYGGKGRPSKEYSLR